MKVRTVDPIEQELLAQVADLVRQHREIPTGHWHDEHRAMNEKQRSRLWRQIRKRRAERRH